MHDVSPHFDSVPRNLSSRSEQATTRSATIPGHVLAAHDDQRVLVVDGYPVRFSPLEYRVMHALLDQIQIPVPFATLAQAAFALDADTLTRRALDKHIDRIRSKLRPCGLTVLSVKTYGYVLLHMDA